MLKNIEVVTVALEQEQQWKRRNQIHLATPLLQCSITQY